MKRILSALLLAVLLLTAFFAVALTAEAANEGSLGEIDVYLIAGQSNAAGYGTGTIEEALIDTRYSEGFDNVLYYGEADSKTFSEFTEAKIGMGIGSTRCGAEIGMAAALASGDRMNAIIKYAKGGTPLWPDTAGTYAVASGTWTPPSYIADKNISTSGTKIGLLYTEFIDTVTSAVSELREMGYTPVLRGMWWMQGEAESGNLGRATEYSTLLEYLIDDLRRDLTTVFSESAENMPFVMGAITGNHTAVNKNLPAYIANVNEAQKKVCTSRNAVSRVETAGLVQIDEWHYSNQSQHTIGKKFIEVVAGLEGKYSVTYDAVGVKMSGGGSASAGESVTVVFSPQGGYVIERATCSIGDGESVDITAQLESVSGGYAYTFTMPSGNVAFTLQTSDTLAENTPYGQLPSIYTDSDRYPFIVFRAGKLYRVFENWNAMLTDGISLGSADGDTTLLLRRNYSTDEDTTSSQGLFTIKGKLTIDLGGYELTRGRYHLFQVMAKYPEAKGVSTDITIKNGTLVAGGSSIFAINGHGDAGADDNFNFTLDGITIKLLKHSYKKDDGTYTTANTPTDMLFVTYTGGSYNTKVTAVFNDCTIDLRSVEPSRDIDIFDLAETSGSQKTANITVNGGSIIANSLSSVTLSKLGDGDSLVFAAGTKGYTTLVLPSSAAEPTLRVSAQDGSYLEFGSPTASGNDSIYSLSESGYVPTANGDIPTAYTNAQSYPFIAFQDKVFYKAYSTYYEFLTDIATNRITKETVLALRRNYTVDTTSGDTKSNNNDRNLNMLKAHLIIDLGGYTLTRGNLHLFQGMGNGVSFAVTVKNGNVHTSAGTAIVLNNTNSGTQKETISFSFEGVTFTSAANLTNPILDTYVGGTEDGTFVNLTFNGCTFDLRGVTQSGFVLFKMLDKAKVSGVMEEKNKIDYNLVINGGKLILDKDFLSKFTFAQYNEARTGENDRPDTVKLGQYDSQSFTLEVACASNSALSATPAISFLTSGGKSAYPLNYQKSGTNALFTFSEVTVSEENTAYGKIPAQYPAERYPFALFINGAFVKAYPTWYELCNTIGADCNYTSGAENTLLLRRDYSTNECYASSQQLYLVKGKVTIDLGENTFTRGSYHIFQFMSKDTAGGELSEFVVKNGRILTTAAPAIAVNTGGSATLTHTFNVTFNDVTFAFASGANSKELAITSYTGANSNNTAISTVVNATYNDCVFDLGSATNKTIFRLDENNGGTSLNKKPVTVVINGGEIITGDFSKITLATFADGDSVSFGKTNGGEYTVLKQSVSATAPTAEYNGLKFVKTAEDGTTAIYTLVPMSVLQPDFKPLASVTLDSNLIFNIYIPEDNRITAVTLNGKTVELGTAKEGYYLVSTELSAEEGAKTLTLVVTLNIDGISVNGTFTFSTVKYTEKLLATAGVTETEKTLAKDMLAYVKSAYNYFDSADKATVADEIEAVIGNYSKTFAKVEGAGADADDIIAGVTFVLDSTPAIRFYLPEGASLNGYSFKIGNTALEIADSGIETAGDCAGLTYADISLYAYRMIETITIANGANTATYHINEYYDGMDKSDTALVDVVEKFYNYCVSANAYRNYIIENQ